MKKVYVTLLAVIVFAGCQKDEISTPIEKEALQEATLESIEFKDLPESVLNSFDDHKFIKSKSSNAFGAVNPNFPIIKNSLQKGKIAYTIILKKLVAREKTREAPLLYFDNLIITENNDGETYKQIIRYQPNYNWYFNTDRNWSNYTGKIGFYSIEGTELGSIHLKNGQEFITHNKGTVTCTFKLKEVWCTGGEGSMTDQPFLCNVTYEQDSCTFIDNSGGTETTYEDPNQYEGSSPEEEITNGSGTLDGSTTTTNPIIEEPCYSSTGVRLLKDNYGNCIEIEASKNLSDWDYINDNINIDESVYDYPCLVEVLNAVLALNHNLVDETINQFCGNEDYNLTFTMGNCSNNSATACTPDTIGPDGEITIKIQDPNINPIDLAATILHESIHAEMIRFINEEANGNADSSDMPGLLDDYRYYMYALGRANVNHPYMTTHYIEPIANALRSIDNNQYGIDYYKVFAWDGLRDFDYDENLGSTDEVYGPYRNEVTENFNIKCND